MAKSGILVAMALLVGCSGGGLQPAAGLPRPVEPSAAQRRVASYMDDIAASKRLVYVSEYQNDFVAVFDVDGKERGRITDGISFPYGLFVDGQHNLWVANAGNSTIEEFPRGAMSPSTTLLDRNQVPLDATVCPNGTVYVTNYTNLPYAGTISVYAKGSLFPTGKLQYPGQGPNVFLTCDANGNVFTTLYLYGSEFSGGVVEYPAGSQTGAKSLGIALGNPGGGITANAAGNLLIDDQSNVTLCEYTESGSPTGKCITNGVTTWPPNGWIGVAATPKGDLAFGANNGLLDGTSIAFPSGTLRKSYSDPSFAVPIGAAYDTAVSSKKK